MSDMFEFKDVENVPTLARNRVSLYQDILKQFVESGKPSVELCWKGKASMDTVSVSLRQAKKKLSLNDVIVTSRAKKEGDKRITYAIYLSKIKPKTETAQKKKAK